MKPKIGNIFVFISICLIAVSAKTVTGRQQRSTDTCGVIKISSGIIFDGQRFSRGNYPWNIALMYSFVNPPMYFCVGTLISKTFVISAAHCINEKHSFETLLPRDVLAFFGAHNLSNYFESGRYSLSPKKIFLHDDWNPHTTQYDGDLSLLQFEEGSIHFDTYVQPICLWDSENEPTETEGRVSGWVRNEDRTKKHLTEPKSIKILIQGDDICLPGKPELAGSGDLSSEGSFCAGSLRNGTGVCQRDSGGVLIIKVDGAYHLKGFVSSSLLNGEDCDASKNLFYANVLLFKDWIKKITGGAFVSTTTRPFTTSTQRTVSQPKSTQKNRTLASTRSQSTAQRPDRTCFGTNGRMSVPSHREYHYKNLRDRYTNCTHVDGNLEITWIQNDSYDLSFLQHIREVTGYVLISHVDTKQVKLPRLRIIRGRTLFKLNVWNNAFSLFVSFSQMQTLELPALRETLKGSVGMFNNYNLCHIRTIEWDEIVSGSNATNMYTYNFTLPERECPPCHMSCEKGCWGEGPENCQKFSKTNCSPHCSQGRCFGPKHQECCHSLCVGGCTGPTPRDCFACRHFDDDGECKQECPAMQVYNPTNDLWEPNSNGKFAYLSTCLEHCPVNLLKDNGTCVRTCSPNKMPKNDECVLCNGPCPKTCSSDGIVHSRNIDNFKDCTVIEGSLDILDQTFAGYQQVYSNFSFGPRFIGIHPDRLEVFSTLKEITGYLNIQGYHDQFTNLSYFRSLEVIGGRQLKENLIASLSIDKTSLRSLGLKSLKRVNYGAVVIVENKHLCFDDDIDWNQIKKSKDHELVIKPNRNSTECKVENEVSNSPISPRMFED